MTVKYYSIYPRWDVDWKSVDWRKVAQDEGLIKRDECHGYRRDSYHGDWCECGKSLAWHVENGVYKSYRDYEAERIAAANVAAIYAVQPVWPNTSKQPKPVEKPADPRAVQIQKAVARLNEGAEYRLGCQQWSPE